MERAPVDINRLSTDIFDFIASKVGSMWSAESAPLPDMARFNISRLITKDDISSPEKYYAGAESVPDIRYKRAKQFPFIDIFEGTFPSPVESPFPANNTVHVLHYRLRRGKKGRPVVVMINGLHVDTNFYFDWWCWRFAAWGLDSVLITMPYSMQRVPEKSHSGQYTLAPDMMWTLLSLRQSFLDLKLLVNRLAADGYGKIGTFGVSYSALMSGIYVCQARSADFAILGMPPMDFVEVLHQWDFADELREREKRGETTMLSDLRIPKLLNMSEMKPNIPTSNIFVAKGKFDHLVTPESIDRTAENWGGLPWLREYPTGHINTFALNFKFILDVRKFIHTEIL